MTPAQRPIPARAGAGPVDKCQLRPGCGRQAGLGRPTQPAASARRARATPWRAGVGALATVPAPEAPVRLRPPS